MPGTRLWFRSRHTRNSSRARAIRRASFGRSLQKKRHLWGLAKRLAEAGEVEVDRDGVTFRGNDLDGGGVGGKGFGREIEFEGSAGHDARTMAPATVV